MNVDRWSLPGITSNTEIILGEAAKSIVITANELKIPGFDKVVASQSEINTYIPFVRRLKAFLPENSTSDDILTYGQMCDLIWKVIMQGGDEPYNYQANRNSKDQVIPNPTAFRESILKIYQCGGYLSGPSGERLPSFMLDGFYDVILNKLQIRGDESVTRAIFAKALTGAYEFKYYQKNKDVRRASARLSALQEDPILDTKILGPKAEFKNDITGIAPTISLNGETVYMRPGTTRDFPFSSDKLVDGATVTFYWSIDGISKGIRMEPMPQYVANLQGVTITAPPVTEETVFNLYIYISTLDGRTAEMFREIVVRPDQAPGIAWDKTLGGSGNDKANSVVATSDGGYIIVGSSD